MIGFELMVSSPAYFWLICFLSVMAVSTSKAGFGGGISSMSLPIMLFVLPPRVALGVMLPIFFVIDICVALVMRRRIERRLLTLMCGFGVAGQLVGWLAFDHLSERVLIGAIALMGILTAMNYFRHVARPGEETSEEVARRMTRRVWLRAPCWCGLSGVASFVSLSGGVPAQIFLLPHGLSRQAFVGTMSFYFMFINSAKFPFYLELGLFTADTLWLSFVLLPVIAFGIVVGRWLNQKMSDRVFYHVSHLLLFVLSAKLLLDAVWQA